MVATDTMKNFILRESLAYEGGTLEGLLEHLGRGFLATYPVMEAVRMTGREHRFDRLSAASCSRASPATTRSRWSSSARTGSATTARGREDMRLLKVTGSSFTRFARDEYTTLPERVDRPLLIRMDVSWRYGDPGADHVDPWEVREHVAATFDDFVSESIQHLVHEMGLRMLDTLAAARRGLLRGREPHARPGGRGRRPQALHRPVPRAGPDHPDDDAMSGRLTTHVLDTARGRPAAGIPIELARLDGERREVLRSRAHQRGRAHGRAAARASSRPAPTS